MVDSRKLNQSCSRLLRLNRVRIWGQFCLYVSAIFSSEAGTRFVGMRTGSASQLELVGAADVGTGSEAILAWSELLDFLAAGVSVFCSATVRLRAAAGCGVECAVRI